MQVDQDAEVTGSGPRQRVGTLDDLEAKGYLTGKVGSTPVCVFLCDGEAYAVDDRCPHMGFPLHRGSVENGLLTCHWHHARFDLVSGGTLDPFADDVRAHSVQVDNGEVVVVLRPETDPAGRHVRRLEEGLEQGLTLVIAKAVLGLAEVLGPEQAALEAIRTGVGFGVRNRDAGWGAGLTVLTAMANVLPRLAPDDRPWPSCTGWRSCPGTPGAGRPGSRWPRWKPRYPRSGSCPGTGAL